MLETVNHSARVNFVVAGMQKGGTKALHSFLSQHPEIGLVSSPRSEPHFFDTEEYFRGEPDYQQYHSWFSEQSLARVTGDITPIYTYWKPCIGRIKAYNPHMKIIVLLRNPVSRAYSHWNMEFSRGDEPDQFCRAILKEPFRRGLFAQHRVYSYLHRGFYSRQIKHLLDHFPRQQCLFVKSEELKNDHQSTMQRILAFLQVDTGSIAPPDVIHAGKYPPLSPRLHSLLKLYYRRDIKRLEQLTGMEFSSWLD